MFKNRGEGNKMALFLKKMFSLPAELWQNRRLIWKLSKNDFKTRYAGSYLGIIWAFVQPVITILVYWLVFEKGFSAKGEMFKSGDKRLGSTNLSIEGKRKGLRHKSRTLTLTLQS